MFKERVLATQPRFMTICASILRLTFECQTEVKDHPQFIGLTWGDHKYYPVFDGYLGRNSRYKSLATQSIQDAGWEAISHANRQSLSHHKSNQRRSP